MNSHKLQPPSKRGIPVEWLSKCATDEEREELKSYLANSQKIFDMLRDMLQRRYDSEWGANVTDYDSPSWSHKQAHKNGRINAYEEIYKLLP